MSQGFFQILGISRNLLDFSRIFWNLWFFRNVLKSLPIFWNLSESVHIFRIFWDLLESLKTLQNLSKYSNYFWSGCLEKFFFFPVHQCGVCHWRVRWVQDSVHVSLCDRKKGSELSKYAIGNRCWLTEIQFLTFKSCKEILRLV